MIKEVIKFAKFYLELGYNIQDSITMAIKIMEEKNIDMYEPKI